VVVEGSDALGRFRTIAEAFAREHLSEYLIRLNASGWPKGRKEINDSLWGTISLTAQEVAVVDSPLVQRLRSIRQLGVVHWVYPGAVHTRFEHTLGVLHQVQHLITAINALGLEKNGQAPVEAQYTALLRLCAILHDVGHSAFSHVIEKALQALPGAALISASFALRHGTESKQLSEIFAFYVIRSPAMAEFLGALLDQYPVIRLKSDSASNVSHTVELMSKAIVGLRINDRVPLLHEIISGPFDADKLDYFARDARCAGIPSLLDISRLVQKMSIRELAASDLPPEIAKEVNKIEGTYTLFGMKWSGIAVLDELHLSRVLLYAKIYRHPKVLAVEQMLKVVVETLASLTSFENLVNFVYGVDDDHMLRLNRVNLVEILQIDTVKQVGALEKLDAAIDILKAVRERHLFVRAFALQRRYPTDPLERDEQQKQAIAELHEDFEHPQKQMQIKQGLLKELEQIIALLGLSTDYPKSRLEVSVALQALGQQSGGTQIARAFLLPADGKPMPFRDYTVNRGAWADSYTSDLSTGYVFATHDLADYVYLAFQKLVRTEYGVRLPDSAIESSKRRKARLEELKGQLGSKGYYKSAPYDIRPLPGRMNKADVDIAISEFAEKASKYQTPSTSSAGIAPAKWKDRVFDWLRQFDDDDHIECALQVLKSFRMLERRDTVDAIRDFIRSNPQFRDGIVVPFGNMRDSGAIQTYYSADLIPEYISAAMTLDEACKSKNKKPIIIVDDFVASGGQGQDILAAGFGEPSLRVDLGEERQLFEDEKKEYLRSIEVGFVFTAAWNEGMLRLKEVARKLGLKATFARKLFDEDLPFAFDLDLHASPDVKEAFQRRCEVIGKSLLVHAKQKETGKTATKAELKKIDGRALGYGNKGMLLASPFNVPTQTLTAIWAEGEVDGIEWQPLFPRRKKL
jgi:HD superfamily phosphohydrolase